MREIVHTLPGANFDLLKRIVEHLERYAVLMEAREVILTFLAP